jgi:tetraacyldisaccharide 4'-kinase
MNIFNNKVYQFFLYPLSLIYGIMIWFRNKLYDKNIFRFLKITNCKIISVGNITIGGTGKTPVIRFLADHLKEMGFKVAVLSRGYRRKSKGTVVVSDGEKILAEWEEAGDEPYLLARQLNKIPIVVESDRSKGALFIQQEFEPDVILLDDGYQHRRLYRDLDIVLIDASVEFGNGFLLPAGFLREPISSLKRADLIWFTRVDQSKNFDRLIKQIRNICSCPIVTSNHQAEEIIQANTGNRLALSHLNQKRVLLFSGIANPASFKKTIINLGAKVVHHVKFSDHYQYKKLDINKLILTAQNVNADMILTTEKDYVRIIDLLPNLSNIYFLTIEIRIVNCLVVLKNTLNSVLSDYTIRRHHL